MLFVRTFLAVAVLLSSCAYAADVYTCARVVTQDDEHHIWRAETLMKLEASGCALRRLAKNLFVWRPSI
jgi:hypothetical protein